MGLHKGRCYDESIRAKFTQEPWNKLLIATGDTQIIEWNNWGDKYWGADIITGKGLNRLGCLLMTLRKEFKLATPTSVEQLT